MVFLDLAKAFDTIPHWAVKNALRRHNVPNEVIDAILEMYKGAYTKIKVKDQWTRKIKLNNGVKQGCPMSPLLFNLVMDELITNLEETNVGIDIDGAKINCLAFADDLVLMTENYLDMNILLKRCEKFFKNTCLRVNASKCLSFRATTVKDKKSFKVYDDTHRWWENVPLPSLTYENLCKYLGIKLNPLGEVVLPIEQWNNWFESLRKAALKPQQRIIAIKEVIIPKILHQLRLSQCGIGKLKKVNQLIRKWFKKFLHLPEWTPDAWIHIPGGGSLLDITELILLSRRKASGNMSRSSDPVANYIGGEINSLNESLLSKIGEGTNNMIKANLVKQKSEKIKRLTNGKAIYTMCNSIHNRTWMLYSKLPANLIIYMYKILSGTIPTRINQHRGNKDANKSCRRCGKTAETDLHILNECVYTKEMQMKRHNKIAQKIGSYLIKNKFKKVWHERTWRIDLENFKPDITAIKEKTMYFIEITCPYEKSIEVLKTRSQEKVYKYRKLTIENLKYDFQEVETTKTIAVAIGSGGTVADCTINSICTELNLPKKCITDIQKLALIWSAKIVKFHTR